MSELQPGLLEKNTEWAKTLVEAFGFPLHQLYILDDTGRAVCHSMRQKVLAALLDESIKWKPYQQPQG